MNLSYPSIVEQLSDKKELTTEQASWIMNETMSGNLTSAQIAGWLLAARCKGETPAEIARFATIMREKAVQVPDLPPLCVDTCGTGGDKSDLINISTLSAMALAAQNIPVAKHGNRAISSKSGSADILEKLGYPLSETPEEISQRIKDKSFAFLFAPNFHPAMKYAGPVRKELGVRTVFNILGPLSNPARAGVHLLGVYTAQLLDPMAQCLNLLGVSCALVVHGEPGLDEISPVGKTKYRLLHKGTITPGELDSSDFALTIKNLESLKAPTAEVALEKAQNIMNGTFLEGIEAVSLNATAALYLYELALEKTDLPLKEYIQKNVKILIEKITSKDISLATVI
ncbi:MAG: anthranilate phosphoribosyltransferase [Leptospirales bacterium]